MTRFSMLDISSWAMKDGLAPVTIERVKQCSGTPSPCGSTTRERQSCLGACRTASRTARPPPLSIAPYVIVCANTALLSVLLSATAPKSSTLNVLPVGRSPAEHYCDERHQRNGRSGAHQPSASRRAIGAPAPPVFRPRKLTEVSELVQMRNGSGASLLRPELKKVHGELTGRGFSRPW